MATIAARESERAPRAGHHPRRGWAQRHQRAGDGGWVLRVRRVIAWAVGIAAMTGVSAAMLMTTVPGDRGRDEINLVTIHELPLPSGGVLTQAVPLQRASPYDIRLPYHWRGERPARVEVQLTGATVFPYSLRLANFLAVSDQPFSLDRQLWLTSLRRYHIDGKPIFDLGSKSDLARIAEIVSLPDISHEQARGISTESGSGIRERLAGTRVITDDNMGTEWK